MSKIYPMTTNYNKWPKIHLMLPPVGPPKFTEKLGFLV
jgi:hypothetical protein